MTGAIRTARPPKTIVDRLGVERNRIPVPPQGIHDYTVFFTCLAVREYRDLDAGRQYAEAVRAMRVVDAEWENIGPKFAAAAFPHLAPIVVNYLFGSPPASRC